MGLLWLFVVVMLMRQAVLLYRLERIDPLRMTVREVCRAASAPLDDLWVPCRGAGCVGFRGNWAVPGQPGMRFAFGPTVGIPLGLALFLRMLREVDALRDALQEE